MKALRVLQKIFLRHSEERENVWIQPLFVMIGLGTRENMMKCGSLRDLVPFAKFYYLEKHPWSNVTLSKTPAWVFFTFFKLYKWYQIAQSVTSTQKKKKKKKKHMRINHKTKTRFIWINRLPMWQHLFFPEKECLWKLIAAISAPG